ncbi:MAG: hypothetical protein QF903_03270 [Planctomycetota bacterium]|jgi:hypothetical protein|nr:hypothetical protein [Planctomycetota bacterium]MDP6764320.1 hypothetical protein [Planctomycetota bacterium]MDP6988476.1 hypothetical protein [Planctomycetota bacterium]
MRTSITQALLAGAALLSLAGAPQDPDGGARLAERVDSLERELSTTRASLAALTTEASSTADLARRTAAWARAQAAAATAMTATLDAAEGAGFTKGINFTSREILLAGWRRSLAALGEDLPGGAARPAPATPGAKRRP